MDVKELWEYFKETEHYSLQQGKAMEGFMPDWIENSMHIINGITIYQVRK